MVGDILLGAYDRRGRIGGALGVVYVNLLETCRR
jgi:hypothetical protein